MQGSLIIISTQSLDVRRRSRALILSISYRNVNKVLHFFVIIPNLYSVASDHNLSTSFMYLYGFLLIVNLTVKLRLLHVCDVIFKRDI